MDVPHSKLALAAAALGVLGIFDAAMGPVLIHLGWVSPMFGFQWLFGMGLLEGLVALALGVLALRATRPATGRSGRPLAWVGIGSGILLAAVLARAVIPSADLPPINDITTNLEDPPLFSEDPAGRGRDMAYPPAFVPQVRSAYPDLAPMHTDADSARALEQAETVARELGWEVVKVDPAGGTLLARDTTGVFRFVDDIVVRARSVPGGGTVIDLRSKSRDGRGDLGANAARIRRFLAAYPTD